MLDILKIQMITMTMISSMNGSMTNLLCIFFATNAIDYLTRNGRGIWNRFFVYTNSVKKHSKTKSSSIHIYVNTTDLENILGQAVLDYITNHANTKHVSYKNKNFILNQSDHIRLDEDVFVTLKDNHESEKGVEQSLEIYSYGKSMKELRSFLNKVSHEYKLKIQNKLGDKIFYFNQHPASAPIGADGEKDYSKLPNTVVFTMKQFQTNRKFSNLFGPEMNIVRKRVEFFVQNKKWYEAKGIPYTLGLLLSGQAGAGKTSTIKCLANETKRHIFNIQLTNDITKTQFEHLFFDETVIVLNMSTGQTEKYSIPLDQRIYVLEDIDCQGEVVMERRPNILASVASNPRTFAEKIDLAFLLNILDGVLEIPGRIVIMTSNYPQRLDHALIRPGRIDILADFKKCDSRTLVEMIEFFYDIALEDQERQRILSLPPYFISPAEMGKVMFENFDDYFWVLESLCKMGSPKN